MGLSDNVNAPPTYPNEPDRSVSQVSLVSVDDEVRFSLTPTPVSTYSTKSGQATKHNLPSPPTSLIGREKEVAAACAFLRQPEVRLLTFSGVGGVGKTCLGLQIATDLFHDFADGVCFISLAPISDPDLVIPAIAQTLGLRESGDQPTIELLVAFLCEKELLLFLDNFEQVIDAAPVLTELLRRCPSLKMLVTSREVLQVRAELEFPILPLAFPDLSDPLEPASALQYSGVALFLQRAQSFTPDFQITNDNVRSIAEICAHLDGLPLALELAATHIKLLSPKALLMRLEHRFQVLTQGSRDLLQDSRPSATQFSGVMICLMPGNNGSSGEYQFLSVASLCMLSSRYVLSSMVEPQLHQCWTAYPLSLTRVCYTPGSRRGKSLALRCYKRCVNIEMSA